jgi:hypothetical protein
MVQEDFGPEGQTVNSLPYSKALNYLKDTTVCNRAEK